ncbi:MAG: ECF-type sigma factor [Xanthomonadales bacterium]|nr:ECF-type sigma factor [Xanthomonadales bacterium]
MANGLFSDGYQALLSIARTKRRRAGFGDTMQTSDVLHESFLKLTGKSFWQSQEHFMRTAALAMRQVIVDHARARLTEKRGEGVKPLPIDEVERFVAEFGETPEQIVEIAALIEDLEQTNPRWTRIVDARYFAGMTEVETAQVLGLSDRTVRREWIKARDWLAHKMGVTGS